MPYPWTRRLLSTSLAALCLLIPSFTDGQPPPPGIGATTLPLAVVLEYRPAFRHDEEIGDLYVYLDAQPFAWVAQGGQMAPAPEVRFDARITPGPHVLRLAMENHQRLSGREWSHQARVSRVEVFFHLADEGDVSFEIRLIESRSVFSSGKGPLTIMVTQGERTVQNLEKVGEAPADWPELCEEVEADLPPGKKISRKIRSRLEKCERWANLWRSAEGEVPTREAARARLERYEYRPRFAASLAGPGG